MSNSAVGQLYKRIIDAVVEASRTDFEESGIDNRTLVDLQDRWQTKLSNLHRATFPWDPQPQAQATAQAETPTIPSNSGRSNNNVSTQNAAPESSYSSAPQQQNAGGVQVKTEPGYDQSFLNLPQSYSGQGQNAAPQRAMQLMQERYGAQAQASIANYQAQTTGQNNAGGQYRQQNGQNQRPPQSQQNQPPALKQENSSPAIPQTDGSSDATGQWDAIVLQRNSRGDDEPLGRIEADGFIRRQVEEMSQRLEAGGLLVPLDEKRPLQKKRKGKKSTPNTSTSGPSRYDGAESDEEDKPIKEDEDDAINSDLDDSDDDIDEGIEPSMEGDTILCLYDKVQRVKNKWKCTLKDGIVTVGGKDYVFHKASGEFEW